MADIEDVVQSHTVQMVMMASKLDNITEGMNDMKIILREISATQQNMAILMERVENHEENTKKEKEDVKESFRAVHARITRVEEDTNEMKKHTQLKCDLITPMAEKGASVHKILMNTLIGLSVAVFGIVGVAVMWVIEQGGAK